MAQIIRLDLVHADRALAKFRAGPDRPCRDSLYGPAPKGLSMIEIVSLRDLGLADVRKMSGRQGECKVTLTATGKRERDREERKAR